MTRLISYGRHGHDPHHRLRYPCSTRRQGSGHQLSLRIIPHSFHETKAQTPSSGRLKVFYNTYEAEKAWKKAPTSKPCQRERRKNTKRKKQLIKCIQNNEFSLQASEAYGNFYGSTVTMKDTIDPCTGLVKRVPTIPLVRKTRPVKDKNGKKVLIDIPFVEGSSGTYLEVVDSHDLNKGLEFFDAHGRPVFLSPPRNATLANGAATTAINFVKGTDWARSLHGWKCRRGPTKHGENGNSTVCMGKFARQGGKNEQPPITNGKINGKLRDHYFFQAICKHTRHLEDLMTQWLPSDELRGLQKAMKNVKKKHLFDDGNRVQHCGGLASSINHTAGAHKDEDAYLSILTTYLKGRPSENDPVCQYFCFPEIGIAIALRPGSVLYFNPNVVHCCSRKTAEYCQEDVYISSHYLKTKHVSGNDNSKQLTRGETLKLKMDYWL